MSALGTNYPQSWAEYHGQPMAKSTLQTMADSAAKRGEPMEHVMIASPWAGQGKTALALLVAAALGREPLIVSGTIKLAQARMIFADLVDGDVIVWDEFHKAMDGGKRHIEWLLHYLQDGALVDTLGAEEQPRVTIITATTDKGLLPESILSRFTIVDLVPYTDEDGMMIAGGMADKVLTSAGLETVCDESAAAIAVASNNQPRTMRVLLTKLRDLAVTEQITPIDGKYELDAALEMVGLTADGLNTEAQQYLIFMLRESQGEAVGVNRIKERLGLVGGAVALTEKVLLNKGYIAMNNRGRALTGAGIRRAKVLAGK